jgi:hypothetical protein
VRPRLRVRVVRASTATESLFIRLWQLRRELIELQADVPEHDDYASFRSFFIGDEARVTLIIDRKCLHARVPGLKCDECIRGFLGWHLRPLDTDAGRVGIIDSDYFFVETALRGHPVMLSVVIACYLHAAWAYRTGRVAIVGHGYPASVISGARFESYNPNWAQGWGLPYLIHVSPTEILVGALRIAKAASS